MQDGQVVLSQNALSDLEVQRMYLGYPITVVGINTSSLEALQEPSWNISESSRQGPENPGTVSSLSSRKQQG